MAQTPARKNKRKVCLECIFVFCAALVEGGTIVDKIKSFSNGTEVGLKLCKMFDLDPGETKSITIVVNSSDVVSVITELVLDYSKEESFLEAMNSLKQRITLD